jgi:hypothetical protein
LVKTTPKPNATKNSKGDELGLFLSPPELPLPSGLLPVLPFATVLVGEGTADVFGTEDPVVVVGLLVEAAMADEMMLLAALVTTCLASIRTSPTI